MWVEDVNEFSDFVKGLLVFLPLLVMLGPVSGSHDFPVYRMAQFNLHGVPHGCRSAGINLEARSIRSWTSSRHCVLANLKDLSPEVLHEIRNKAGALVVVLPKDMKSPSQEMLEMELSLMSESIPIPVYFSHWSKELEEIVKEVAAQPAQAAAKSGSALEGIVSSVAANGYQLVVSSSSPVPKDGGVASVYGTLLGRGVAETLPSIAIVAHMDAFGAAPDLSFGGDSNGSGIAVLLELARIFSNLYRNPRTHGRYNIIFLLSGAGKMNYLGTKKYLEDQIDSLEGSLLQDAAFVVCLEGLGRNSGLNMHVSKPPKEGSSGGALLAAAQTASHGSLQLIHKKINLADDVLSWEHERFSIRRMPAFTFSSFKSHRDPGRRTIFDQINTVDHEALVQNTAVIAEAMARVIYNVSGDDVMQGELRVEPTSLRSTLEVVGNVPRAATLLVAPADKPAPFVTVLKDLLARYASDVRISTMLPDRRDPDLVLFDATSSTLHVYSVKPAVFDLVLTLVIISYLAIVYLLLNSFPEIFNAVTTLVSSKTKIS